MKSEARWSRDGRWIYFASNRTGRDEVWRMPAAGGAPAQITRQRGAAAAESGDGFLSRISDLTVVLLPSDQSSRRDFRGFR